MFGSPLVIDVGILFIKTDRDKNGRVNNKKKDVLTQGERGERALISEDEKIVSARALRPSEKEIEDSTNLSYGGN